MAMTETEPVSDFLRVRDPRTGGIIICCNRSHVINPDFLEMVCGAAAANGGAAKVPVIDVTTCVPRGDSQAFVHDTFVLHKAVPRYCRMLVDFSCLIQSHLETSGVCIVHCKNGRSRSPNVILAHLMISALGSGSPAGEASSSGSNPQHMTRAFATDWLTTAFRVQRPTIAARSASFPNFAKFDNVIRALEKDVFAEVPWVRERIAENAERFSQAAGRRNRVGMRVASKMVLPASGIASKHVQGQASTETTRRRLKVRKIDEHLTRPDPHPDRHVVGRRVRIFDAETSVWTVGTISDGPLDGGLFKVMIRDRESGQSRFVVESAQHILALFRRGTRVLVDWKMQGTKYVGVISNWDGGNRFAVRYDDDKRIDNLWDAEVASMQVAPAGMLPQDLPRNLLKYIHAVQADEKRIVDAKIMLAPPQAALPAPPLAVTPPASLPKAPLKSPQEANLVSAAAFLSKPEGTSGILRTESAEARKTRLGAGATTFRGVTRQTFGSFYASCAGVYLGTFESAELAAKAYDRAAIATFGRKGHEHKLNFPFETYRVHRNKAAGAKCAPNKKKSFGKRDFDPAVLAGRIVFCQKDTIAKKPKYYGRMQSTGSIKCKHCENIFSIAGFAEHCGRGASNNGWKIVKSKALAGPKDSIVCLEELYIFLAGRKRKDEKKRKQQQRKKEKKKKTKKHGIRSTEAELKMKALETSLSESFTAGAASKMLEGWTVGIQSPPSATRASARYNYTSPEGRRFLSKLEVVRHFAALRTKDEALGRSYGRGMAFVGGAAAKKTAKTKTKTESTPPRKKDLFVGTTLTRSILDPEGHVTDTINAQVTHHFPQRVGSTVPALWQIRHDDGNVENLSYAELMEGLEMHSRQRDEFQRAEFSRQNQWRIAVLVNVLCDKMENVPAEVAFDMLEGWSVQRAAVSATEATFAYKSADGQIFHTKAAVVRHFLGLRSHKQTQSGCPACQGRHCAHTCAKRKKKIRDWTEEEDAIIMAQRARFGKGVIRWQQIAEMLPGRSGDIVKKRHLILRKRAWRSSLKKRASGEFHSVCILLFFPRKHSHSC